MQKLLPFEKKVFDSLKRLFAGSWPKVLGVAVSGGADSVSLLLALAQICAAQKERPQAQTSAGGDCLQVQDAGGQKASQAQDAAAAKIVCVTVDHSIRPEEESAGDAAFVQELCGRLGVECFVKKIPRGMAERVAKERKKGLEDAARALRYKAFEDFAKESGAERVCLAHNQNDALETILMRFLQGSSCAAAGGIAESRGIFLRPLLETSRSEIEEYLRQKGCCWRTDSTNAQNNYLRNKIRNLLVPFLDQNFCGWKKALLAGAEKAAYESAALDEFLRLKLEGLNCGADKDFLQAPKDADDNCLQAQDGAAPKSAQIEFSAGLFGTLPVALRQRLLARAFESLRVEERVPYSFVRELSLWPQKDFKNRSAAGLEAASKKEKVFIKKSQKEATESGFFDIIMEEGQAFVLRSKAVGDKVK